MRDTFFGDVIHVHQRESRWEIFFDREKQPSATITQPQQHQAVNG